MKIIEDINNVKNEIEAVLGHGSLCQKVEDILDAYTVEGTAVFIVEDEGRDAYRRR